MTCDNIKRLTETADFAARLLAGATKGPWLAMADCQTGRDYWHVEVPIGPTEPVSAGILATVKRYGPRAAQAEANANLMAAAPALATALTEAEAEVRQLRAALVTSQRLYSAAAADAASLRAALAEALGWMTEAGHPGEDCLRSGWVRTARVEELRRLVEVKP